MAEGVAVSSSLLQGTSKKCTGTLWAGDGGAHSGVGIWYPFGIRVWLASQSKVLGPRREAELPCIPSGLLSLHSSLAFPRKLSTWLISIPGGRRLGS